MAAQPDAVPSAPESTKQLAAEYVQQRVPRSTLVLGAFTAIVLGLGGAGVWAADSHIDARTRERLAPEAAAREALEERLESHVVESRLAHTAQAQESRETRAEVKEAQADIRALYKYLSTGQRQARLEGDGGAR